MRIMINWRGILGLPSKYVGAVYNKDTKKVCKIINPTYDYELEDNSWIEKDCCLVKIKRNTIPTTMSFKDCAILIKDIENTLEMK